MAACLSLCDSSDLLQSICGVEMVRVPGIPVAIEWNCPLILSYETVTHYAFKLVAVIANHHRGSGSNFPLIGSV